MLIYSFITDYQAFNLRYKDNTTRDKNETKVDKQSANLGKNNEPIQNRLSFLIDCKSVILHHLAILSFPMVRPAWDNWWLLLGIQERLAWDVARLEKVVRSLETERRRFTADDVITMFHKLTKESSLFTFMHGVIAQLKQLGKVRTSETYTATLNSFMTFRDEQDVPLDCRLYVMMLQFLQEELFIFHIVHKITENFTFLQIFIRN